MATKWSISGAAQLGIDHRLAGCIPVSARRTLHCQSRKHHEENGASVLRNEVNRRSTELVRNTLFAIASGLAAPTYTTKSLRRNLFALTLAATLPALAMAQDTATDAPVEAQPEVSNKYPDVLPALSTLMRLPPDLQLRYPDAPVPPEGEIEYNRVFPIGAKGALERGYTLPRPVGLSVIGVRNSGVQTITDLNVALGIDVVPPEDTRLTNLSFVDAKSRSMTTSPQIKADLWVLPFLNVYGVVGKVRGSTDLSVNVDFDQITPICRPNPVPIRPPICVGDNLGGQYLIEFSPDVDATTATIGLTGVYSSGNWFGTATLNRTLTISSKDKSDIKSWGGGLRIGRRWVFGNGNVYAPFFGATYTDVDTRMTGTARLNDVLSDDQDLIARFDVQLENEDKWQGLVGLNVGFNNGFNLAAEYNWAGESDRAVLTLERRF